MKLLIFLLSALLFISCLAGGYSGYVKCSDKEIRNDKVINKILKYGVAYVFEKAADKYGVSDDNPEITKVNSVYKQVSKSVTNYKCDIDATNNYDATLEATFIIEVNHKTNKKVCKQWNYNVQYKSKDDQSDNYDDYTDTNNQVDVELDVEPEQPYNNEKPNNYDDYNDNQPAVDVEVDVEEERPDQYNDYQHTGVDSEADVEVDVEEEKQDQYNVYDDVENDGVIRYGITFIFEKAADKYGVSDDNVEVIKINSVQKKELKDTTTYKCDVDATNNFDATIEARFTIEVDHKTSKMIVRKWKYHMDYKKKDEEPEDYPYDQADVEVDVEPYQPNQTYNDEESDNYVDYPDNQADVEVDVEPYQPYQTDQTYGKDK